jgi:pimeloyl-ACP methyl ester carboxylesterase
VRVRIHDTALGLRVPAKVPRAALPDGYLHYQTLGSGPPLLALLPLSSGPLGVRATLSRLARAFTVVTHDPRGTGDSSPAPDDLSIDTQTRDAMELLRGIGIERTRVLAHSTGCGVGITLAARHSARVERLVLVSPWTHGDPYLSAMQRLRQAAVRSLDPEQYARFNAAILFPPDFRREHQRAFDRLAREARAGSEAGEAFARRLDAILAFDARPLLADVRCPTLVAAARDDQLMPHWFATAVFEGIPGARALWLEHGGHMLLETRSDALLAGLLSFLQARAGAG